MTGSERMHDILRDAIWAGDRGLIVQAHILSCQPCATAVAWLDTLTQSALIEPHRPGRRAIVTCEDCGRRHPLERTLERPSAFHLVCHGCEQSLRVEVGKWDLEETRP